MLLYSGFIGNCRLRDTKTFCQTSVVWHLNFMIRSYVRQFLVYYDKEFGMPRMTAVQKQCGNHISHLACFS